MKETGRIIPQITSTNYLKRNGMLTSYPDIVIRVNGDEYGDSLDSISNLDYAMYRAFGWDWAKMESIKFILINNLNGKEYELEFQNEKLVGIDNIWETEFFKESMPLYEQRRDLIFEARKNAACGSEYQHEAAIKVKKEFREKIDKNTKNGKRKKLSSPF